ncbi:MAG: hypothetical protein KC422_12520 [Trueperaceae bacterium]|nr:hypothetical protein [Trueperaceae bacterium]
MNLLSLPILLPLFSGAVLLLLPKRALRTLMALIAAILTLLVDLSILRTVLRGEVMVLQMSNWPAPWGISLVADGLTGIMLALSGLIALLTVMFASSSLAHEPRRGQSKTLNQLRERFGFQALLQFLIMGVNMSFLTGDLFNLFVAFEVMLISSYGLLLIGNELPQLREGFKYVVVNLLASAVFVVAAGMMYGLVGTLNMADISVKIAEYSSSHGADARLSLLAMMLALVFATKAAVFPLGFWLPSAYPVPVAAASAFFAALLTKVGVYSLIRTFTLLFPQEQLIHTILLVLAAFSMLVGAFGMISQSRWRHTLAFANISSIGYLLMGVFTTGSAGMTGALYYLIHTVLVIFCLFLIAALGEKIAGLKYTVEGHLNSYPWLGIAYFASALALAGIPPSSGFIAKYSLISASLRAGGTVNNWVAAAAVITGLLLLYATVEIWRGFFWGESHAVHKVVLPRGMTTTTVFSLALVISLAVFSGPIYKLAQRTAEQLMTNEAYTKAVLVEVKTPRIGDPALPTDELEEDTH